MREATVLASLCVTGWLALLAAATPAAGTESKPAVVVVPVADVQWQKLNPARGDQSPQAGTLWGDRNGELPTGFLAKFVDGFSSPPHIHNATYRAVVIDGLIHNDDPAAEPMWMPPGSFWTQPKGEVHITAAKGPSNIALVEIDMGPYLVKGIDAAFDSGERPINAVPSNIVWLKPPGSAGADSGAEIAYLWGSLSADHANGTFLKLPTGFEGTIYAEAPTFRAVVVQGQLTHRSHAQGGLLPGSYFGSSGALAHAVSAESETLLYIRTMGTYRLDVGAKAK